MNAENIKNTVESMVREQSGASGDIDGRTLNSSGFDSLDKIEIAMMIESELAIEFPAECDGEWKTVDDIIRHTTRAVICKYQ